MDHRPLTLADAPEVTALINRFERFWNVPLITPEAEVDHNFTEPFLDLDQTPAFDPTEPDPIPADFLSTSRNQPPTRN